LEANTAASGCRAVFFVRAWHPHFATTFSPAV
jgi:hypothetical protein